MKYVEVNLSFNRFQKSLILKPVKNSTNRYHQSGKEIRTKHLRTFGCLGLIFLAAKQVLFNGFGSFAILSIRVIFYIRF